MSQCKSDGNTIPAPSKCMKEITKAVARAWWKTHSGCLSLIRLLCFAWLVFCVITTFANVAPFLVGYSKTYIGLKAQFKFPNFNLCTNLILKSSKTKYREEKLCEGTSSVQSHKVAHYALGIKHCLKLLEK